MGLDRIFLLLWAILQPLKAVEEVLVKEYNLDPKLVTGKGYGESRLLDTKDNEQAHKMNRRIEAIIYALDTQPLKR